MLTYAITPEEWNRALLITLVNPAGSAFVRMRQSQSQLLPGDIAWQIDGQDPFVVPARSTTPEESKDPFRLRILGIATKLATFIARDFPGDGGDARRR